MNIDGYLHHRIKECFESFDIIYSNNHSLDINTMQIYRKNLILGFVPSTELCKEGSLCLLGRLKEILI